MLLEVKDLKVEYHTKTKISYAVKGVSFSMEKGEILGIVGESGSGKSTLGLALMLQLPQTARFTGQVLFKERDLVPMGFNELKKTLCDVSSKTLSSTLKDLEAQNLITREILDTKPPTVRYTLTGAGTELHALLVPLLEWVIKNGGHEEEGCPVHIHGKNVNRDIIQ